MYALVYLALLAPAFVAVWRLARRGEPAVPLVAPCLLFLYEGATMVWAAEGGWTTRVWLVAMSGFFIAGLLLIWDFFSMPRWYYLKGLQFRNNPLQYELLAQKIREQLWLDGLLPSSVQLHPIGLLGVRGLTSAEEQAFFNLVAELPESVVARLRFAWFLWASLALMTLTFIVSALNHPMALWPPFS